MPVYDILRHHRDDLDDGVPLLLVDAHRLEEGVRRVEVLALLGVEGEVLDRDASLEGEGGVPVQRGRKGGGVDPVET